MAPRRRGRRRRPRRPLLALLMLPAAATAQPVTTHAAAASSPPVAAETLRLTRDEAVRMAMENNPELAVVRYEPGASDARVAAAHAAFLPTVHVSGLQRNSAATPPVNLFSGEAGIQTDFWSADAGLGQRLPWGGGSYDVGFIVAADDDRQPVHELHAVADLGAAGDLLAAAAARLQDRLRPGAGRDRAPQPRHRRHPGPGARRAGRGERRARVLGAGGGAGVGRRAAAVAGSGARARADQPRARRRRPVAAARPGGGTRRSRAAAREPDHRAHRRRCRPRICCGR